MLVIKQRFPFQGLIGSGGYGQIYVARDRQSDENNAVKAEPTRRRGKLVRRMILEQRVLVRLQGQPHVPVIYASGCDHDINFIVMQLLSVNVGDLRKQSPLRRLSRSTCGRIIQQSIAALRDLHNVGFLHRGKREFDFSIKDLQMSSLLICALGSLNWQLLLAFTFMVFQSKHRLFLVDYGLVRCYRSPDGRPKPRRKRAGFRGTLRYVSIRVHDREEQGQVRKLY
jgi:serine/threonine protein kinase